MGVSCCGPLLQHSALNNQDTSVRGVGCAMLSIRWERVESNGVWMIWRGPEELSRIWLARCETARVEGLSNSYKAAVYAARSRCWDQLLSSLMSQSEGRNSYPTIRPFAPKGWDVYVCVWACWRECMVHRFVNGPPPSCGGGPVMRHIWYWGYSETPSTNFNGRWGMSKYVSFLSCRVRRRIRL